MMQPNLLGKYHFRLSHLDIQINSPRPEWNDAMHLIEANILIFKFSLKFVTNGPITNNFVLIQVMHDA